MSATITDPTVTVKLEPATYSITWETDTNGHVNVPYLNLKFNPGTETIRVWYNNFRNFGTLTVTDETIDMDDTFNPIIQNVLLDGVVWMYKLEWERNPAGQLAKDLYDEGCALLASVYNADITYL